MNREAAETLALEALAFVIGDARLGPLFLDACGIAPGELASRAQDSAVLTGVLSFLTQEDAWVRAFCDATGRAPTEPQAALWALPGGAPVNWT